ncbi:hypothetical protein KW797_04205, partial [Candidatus Parcubacteria bacterium]|nr:hypothetical protein [Candidatus Parcubacteria bacterium]
MPILIFIVFLVGGSVAFSAERALPGEALYHWKTDVNEPLGLALTRSKSGKATFAARLAGRRLEEAERLLVRKELGAEATAIVLQSMKRSMKETMRRLALVKEDDLASALSIESGFEASLRAH